MKTSTFRLETGDQNSGIVYLPDEWQAQLPVLIICHGWGGDKTLNVFAEQVCQRLIALSMAVVAFDFFGCGETGGDYRFMTYGRWADNLSDVCTYVAAQEWADPHNIGALGISSGTTAVLRCAITYPTQLAFVISVATALGNYIHMPAGPAKLLVDHLDTLSAGGTVELYGTQFGLDFFKDFVSNAPLYHLQNITCPVFFLQGGVDNIYRRTDARLGYEILKRLNQPVDYLEIEHGNHGLETAPEEGTMAVLNWLHEQGIVH
ncbi:alpha/beta hydrolase family protein [Tengunoibacter tsumagoiensis]|uniref:Serine aminopeptidase S33 domain-containing protein n=1 Tax=Tengunoibacter tsumagoiensis TaxID=2014871 RepID=A0A402A8F1_9CHLR|nr:alpha/beta fold hydrolase [Tengunoibacter tsumagoiensis]GCE15378.1 hypothetical protein KTT_52370 [Tengunoibacter tsumagoiensis]